MDWKQKLIDCLLEQYREESQEYETPDPVKFFGRWELEPPIELVEEYKIYQVREEERRKVHAEREKEMADLKAKDPEAYRRLYKTTGCVSETLARH